MTSHRAAGLQELQLAIARTPILVAQTSLESRLADWENTRRAPDVDDVILAWLASQGSARRRSRLC